MAIQIEILNLTPDSVRLALYYVADNPIVLADNQSRVPAGIKLSTAEKTALKAGTLIEFIRTVSINQLTKLQARPYIESRWLAFQDEAQIEYQALYRNVELVGKAFDGTNWS